MLNMLRTGGPSRSAREMPASEITAAFLNRVVHDTGVPGIAVAIHAHGRKALLAAGHTGRGGPPISALHRFHAGCTIKLLLAVAALELANRGRLALDAAIAEAVPELRGTLHGETVQIAHLLSHTSGYRGTHLLEPATRHLDWNRLMAWLRSAPQLFEPGTVFSYEHTESVLLGRILERATGRDPVRLVRETLLEPLGLMPGRLETAAEDPLWAGRHDLERGTGRFKPITTVPTLSTFWNPAFSDFTLSAADLVEIAAALLPDAARPQASPVSAASRVALRQPAVRLPRVFGGMLRESMPTAFGLGAATFTAGLHGHNGLTYGQCVALRYSPDAGVAIAIGMNAMLPHLRDHIVDAVCAELIGRPAASAPAPFEMELAELAGRYAGPGRSRAAATCTEDRLELVIEHGEHRLPIELVLDDDGQPIARSPLPQLALGFFRTSSGEVGLLVGASAFKRLASAPATTAARAAAEPAAAEAVS